MIKSPPPPVLNLFTSSLHFIADLLFLKVWGLPGMVVHIFIASTREAKAEGPLSLRPARSTQQVPGQSGVYHLRSQNNKTKKQSQARDGFVVESISCSSKSPRSVSSFHVGVYNCLLTTTSGDPSPVLWGYLYPCATYHTYHVHTPHIDTALIKTKTYESSCLSLPNNGVSGGTTAMPGWWF